MRMKQLPNYPQSLVLMRSFSSKEKSIKDDHDAVVKNRHTKIGELTVEKDFLEDASQRLGVLGGKK